jgi:hypothetical protein
MKPDLILPHDFDEWEWETKHKGYVAGALVKLGERRIRINFYDPTRLSQDAEETVRSGHLFVITNLVVIPRVDRPEMEEAVRRLADSGALDRFASD